MSDDNQYIYVIIDYLTKSKSVEHVTECLIKFVHQFEAPKRVLTEQGKEFLNEEGFHVHDMSILFLRLIFYFFAIGCIFSSLF